MNTNQQSIDSHDQSSNLIEPDSLKKKYRVFLSYRGKTEGQKFSEELYQHLTQDPFYTDRYGEIYYSPTEEITANFKLDMQQVMKTVEFFILPLTPNFFDGFDNEDVSNGGYESITRIEIQEAINAGSRFICVEFPGYKETKKQRELLYGIYKKEADRFLCEKTLVIGDPNDESNKKEIFNKIALAIVMANEKFKGIGQRISKLSPNIAMHFKSDLEDSGEFPFYEKLFDVKSLTLLNYASSSFISGIDVANCYEDHNPLKNWFAHALGTGKILVNMILTDPHCQAAKEAAMYKMYPEDLTISTEEIILSNMNRLVKFMKEKKNENIKLRIFLTQIALPYGVMLTRNENPDNNHIKVDLYAPVIEHDGKRPSFYIQEKKSETKVLYNFFKDNLLRIMNNYSYRFTGYPNVDWMYDSQHPIIHQGVVNGRIKPHTREGFNKCLQEGLPMEVDLFQLNDWNQTIVVGRQEQIIHPYEDKKDPGTQKQGSSEKIEKALKDCSISDILKHNRSENTSNVLTLDELLNLVRGEIPLLIEIKTNDKTASTLDSATEEYVCQVTRILTKYLINYSHIFRDRYKTNSLGIAVHSADYRVIPIIRKLNCMIPCGIISTDFGEKYPNADDLGDGFCAFHKDYQKLIDLDPDFISYDIDKLDNGIALKVRQKLKIPLLAWTIKSKEQQLKASDYLCENIIIEGGTAYTNT